MTATQFSVIKQYVLLKGDRMTYCNMYNNNPHLVFGKQHVYLNPTVGQANINCDPNLSDFNEIVIQDWSSAVIYFRIKVDDKQQALIFDPQNSENYFEQLYLFVCEKNQSNSK